MMIRTITRTPNTLAMIQILRDRLFLLLLFAAMFVAPRADADPDAQSQMADALIRSAVTLVGASESVESDTPVDLATIALDTALELEPKNVQAWAMRVELAKTAADMDAYENALINYLRTGVRDDTASLELIRMRLSKSSTLDAQLGALTRLLDSEAGRALEGPIRSRLAVLASTVAMELVDEPARRKWAIEAARSDPANRDAAQLMLNLVIELGGDVVRQGTAVINLVRASPLEAGPRLQLARILAEQDAYALAAQQYRVVATRLSSEPLTMPDYVNWAQCLAISGQDETALQLISEFESALNPPAEEGGAEPERFELPFELAVVRLALLQDQVEAAEQAFDQIASQLNALVADAEDAQTKSDASKQLALLAAVMHPDRTKAREYVGDHAAAQGVEPWVKQTAAGWLALRNGDREAAQQQLAPVADRHSLASTGLAMATGVDDAGRANLLRAVLLDQPTASPGALIAGRALLKLDVQPRMTPAGQALANLMSKYSQSFWRIDLERTPWLEVRFDIDPARIKPLEPVVAQVTVWNTTRLPLAIGDGAAIQPKAIVLLGASSSGQPGPPLQPVVVNLDRRLTLAAGERLIFETRLDYHQLGVLRESSPGRPFIFSARLVVNPGLNPAGAWLTQGIGRSAEVRNAVLEAKPANLAGVDQWLKEIQGSDRADRLYAAQRLASLSPASQPELVTAELIEQIKPKLVAYWDQGSPAERAWLIYNCQSLDAEDAAYPELLERALASDHKLVWMALLLGHAEDSSSSILRAAVQRQDLPDVSRFGGQLRRLLRETEEIDPLEP